MEKKLIDIKIREDLHEILEMIYMDNIDEIWIPFEEYVWNILQENKQLKSKIDLLEKENKWKKMPIISSDMFSQEAANKGIQVEMKLNKLKQALIDIREYVESGKFSAQFENPGNEANVELSISQIIREALGE